MNLWAEVEQAVMDFDTPATVVFTLLQRFQPTRFALWRQVDETNTQVFERGVHMCRRLEA